MSATRTFTVEVREALARVALTPEEVVRILGSCLEGGDVHLVGSLAAGLGNNRGSDVDLHVFVDEPAPGVVPMPFFAGQRSSMSCTTGPGCRRPRWVTRRTCRCLCWGGTAPPGAPSA